jgi:hypothetical protein
MSFNKLGNSKYLPDTLRAKTSSKYWNRIFKLCAAFDIAVIKARRMWWEGHVVYVRKCITGQAQRTDR